jgi:hypothetical protein
MQKKGNPEIIIECEELHCGACQKGSYYLTGFFCDLYSCRLDEKESGMPLRCEKCLKDFK